MSTRRIERHRFQTFGPLSISIDGEDGRPSCMATMGVWTGLLDGVTWRCGEPRTSPVHYQRTRAGYMRPRRKRLATA